MRVLFIGGSNTVIDGGYTRDFVRCLSETLGCDVQDDSVAVGGSPCTLGLQRLLALTDLDYDLFVIEYMANDFGWTRDEQGFATWRATYEGIVRVLRHRAPRAHILSVLLGRRSSKDDAHLARMSDEIKRLSEHYGAVTADVHAFLAERAPDEEARAGVFRDNAHYTEPYMTALVGLLAATAILPHLQRPAVASALPAPRSPVSFEHATVTSLSALGATFAPAVRFENSRYSVEAARLTAEDGPREVLLPGALISLAFVSTPDAGRLLIEEAGRPPVTADTLSQRVADGDFRFLLRSTTFARRRWEPSDATPRTVRLRVLADAEPPPPGAEHQPGFNMVAPQRTSGSAAHLIDALCFGLP